jgi:hypothetical protein
MSTPLSTPQSPRSTPPPLDIPTSTQPPPVNRSRSRSRSGPGSGSRTTYSTPRVEGRSRSRIGRMNLNMRALFSPTPILPRTIEPEPTPPLPLPLQGSVPLDLGSEDPTNIEYWRVNWRQFIKTPLDNKFSDAIKYAPLEYQDDINKILFQTRTGSGSTHGQPRRL